MVKLLMIADDFTGALDTGVQFAKRGICTQIFTKQKLEDADVRPETEVLVVDTESRPMEKAEAYEAVHEIAAWAVRRGVRIIFKKQTPRLEAILGLSYKQSLTRTEMRRCFLCQVIRQLGESRRTERTTSKESCYKTVSLARTPLSQLRNLTYRTS